MNIFFLDKDPRIAAQMQCDEHIKKMIIEYAQMLSTAHRMLDGEYREEIVIYAGDRKRKKKFWDLTDPILEEVMYLPTHYNHPATVWCRLNVHNYNWLFRMYEETCNEYAYRFRQDSWNSHKAPHKSSTLLTYLAKPPVNIKKNIADITVPPQTVSDNCRDVFARTMEDIVSVYRKFYILEKSSFATWSKRPAPDWYLKGLSHD